MTLDGSNSGIKRLYDSLSRHTNKLRFGIYFLSISIRLLLIAYSLFHNLKFDVKYSDIDYIVYSDSAKHLLEGKSPYLRHTYRYTPLLSLLMVFNERLFHDFGKILFSFSDIMVGFVLEKSLKSYSNLTRMLLASVWLLNPFAIAISSRGNADTLICLMVVSTLYFIMNSRVVLAALMFGLSVHFKIYPVVYALAFMLYLYPPGLVSKFGTQGRKHFTHLLKFPLVLLTNLRFEHIVFALLSFATFAVLTYLTYHFYGFESIYETYLYQYVRKDHRHNFSIYFNLMYYTVDSNMKLNPFFSFLPQLVCVLLFSLIAFVDLPLSLFLITLSFVILNKVLTSQYFLWWIALLPLVVHNLGRSWQTCKHFLLSVVSLLAFKFLWLFWGYRQEFLGYNSFNEMLFSSSFLLISHMMAAWTLLYQSFNSKREARLT